MGVGVDGWCWALVLVVLVGVLMLMVEFTTVNSPVSREGDISKACDIDELSRPLRYIHIFIKRLCVLLLPAKSP